MIRGLIEGPRDSLALWLYRKLWTCDWLDGTEEVVLLKGDLDDGVRHPLWTGVGCSAPLPVPGQDRHLHGGAFQIGLTYFSSSKGLPLPRSSLHTQVWTLLSISRCRKKPHLNLEHSLQVGPLRQVVEMRTPIEKEARCGSDW